MASAMALSTSSGYSISKDALLDGGLKPVELMASVCQPRNFFQESSSFASHESIFEMRVFSRAAGLDRFSAVRPTRFV